MLKIFTTLLIGVAVVALYSSLQINRNDLGAGPHALIESNRIQAHDLAASGIEYAMKRLADDRTWANEPLPATISIPGVTIKVAQTQSEYMDGSGGDLANARFVTSSASVEDKVVTVQAVIDIPGTSPIPSALRYALFSGKSLQVDQNLLVQDFDNPRLNASVHTNEHMAVLGNSLITGFGTFSGSLGVQNEKAEKVFKPNLNRGGNAVYRHPAVDMPELNLKHWERIATRTYASSTTMAGKYRLGTMKSPDIVLIKGYLTLKADFVGSGIIFVEGDLRLNSLTVQNTAYPTKENVCIIVAGDVYAEGSKLNATVICGGNFYGSGNVVIAGSLLAGGEVLNNGTLDIYYREFPEALAAHVWKTKLRAPRIAMCYE